MCESAYERNNVFKTTRGASEGLEILKAEQSVEDIDHLVECFRIWMSTLFNNPLNEDTQALSPSFVPCPYHLLKVRVECGQPPEPTRHEPVGIPEATEDPDVVIQCLEWVRSAEGSG